jgi:hypothetical protein
VRIGAETMSGLPSLPAFPPGERFGGVGFLESACQSHGKTTLLGADYGFPLTPVIQGGRRLSKNLIWRPSISELLERRSLSNPVKAS